MPNKLTTAQSPLTPTAESFTAPAGVSANNNSANSGRVVAWGDNSAGQVTMAPPGSDFSGLAPGGGKQSIAIRHDGTLFEWGGLGVPQPVPPIPTSYAGDKFASVAIGLTHAVAVRHNKTIVSWGDFLSGNAIVPPSGFRATQVAAAANHDVGLSVTGDLEEWGAGSGASHAPTGKFSAVGARSGHSIALRKDGTLFGWGGGALAATLFSGWTSDGDEHFYVPGDAFIAIAAGNTHILALRAVGTVAGWGNNSGGQTTAPAGVHFTAIAAGNGFSIGLDVNGLVHYWGSDVFGVSAVPTNGPFQAIGAAARHATAITAK